MSTQQGQAPDLTERHRPFKRKGKKPIIVEWRAKGGRSSLFFKDWTKFGRYKDTKTAEGVLRQKQHDRWFEYRIQPCGGVA